MHIRKKLLRFIPTDRSTSRRPIPPTSSSDTLAVVIHTCDRYAFCWSGWNHYFQRHWDASLPYRVYFLNEDVDVPYPGVIHQPTGKSEWSDRLRRGLEAIPESYVLYMQEDFWLTHALPVTRYYDTCRALAMDALRVAPLSTHYSVYRRFTVDGLPLHRFDRTSHYLVSHQPTIWRKDFLLSCLGPGENPWVNEEDGTRRLQRLAVPPRIYLSPLAWYAEVCRGGKLTGRGIEMLRAVDRTRSPLVAGA